MVRKVFGIDVVEDFNDRVSQLLFDPAAFRQSIFDAFNFSIALAWIIIAGINHDLLRVLEKTAWEFWNFSFRNGDDYQVATARRLLHSDGFGAGLFRQPGKRFRSARVGDDHVMPQAREMSGQRRANVSSSNNPNFHFPFRQNCPFSISKVESPLVRRSSLKGKGFTSRSRMWRGQL